MCENCNCVEYKCQYCGKICKNANSLRNHERLCKLNPNKQKNSQEGKTGWSKGLTKNTDPRIQKMSESLKKHYHKEFQPYNCEVCGKLVEKPYGSNKYCSRECANKHVISQEQKVKISKTMKKVWEARNVEKPEQIKMRPKKSILDLSKRTISKILKRANQGCMICGWNESTCDIHHIIPKKHGGTDENENLIVICPNCHRKVHTHKLELDGTKNIKTLFSGWINYYYVDLKELDNIIEENKNSRSGC